MSGEYKELIDRLAAARNHDGGSYILITSLEGEPTFQTNVKSNLYVLINGAADLVKKAFEQAEQAGDITAQTVLCDWLTDAIKQNQEKRFQETVEAELCK